MSRSSLILGFVIAVLVHAVLFLPSWLSNPPPPEQTPEPPDGSVTIVVPPPPRVEPAVPEQPPAAQPPLSDVLRLAEVVQPRAEDAKLPKEGETAVAAADDDQALPATRIVWESPAELRAVARELGMRVVAVTRANEVVGEVALDGVLRLAPFRLRFETYSNRVRSLPASFFGPSLDRDGGRGIMGFWVLVPEPVDLRMAEVVRAAIHRAGLAMSDVDWVEARFAADTVGRHKFVVMNIHGFAPVQAGGA